MVFLQRGERRRWGLPRESAVLGYFTRLPIVCHPHNGLERQLLDAHFTDKELESGGFKRPAQYLTVCEH